jgi:lipoyl(octanoyl) transferase 2
VSQDTKIAALGVHLRRNVTSHGVGLNVWTDLRWFERIVACGLEGKRVTSMWEDVRRRNREDWRVEIGGRDGVRDMIVEEVAGLWVSDFARECGLKAGDVVKVSEKDVLAQGDAEGA